MLNILEGWKNVIVKNEAVENVALKRAETCMKCKHSKNLVVLSWIDRDIKKQRNKVCEICNCPLIAKIRSRNETCPKNYW